MLNKFSRFDQYCMKLKYLAFEQGQKKFKLSLDKYNYRNTMNVYWHMLDSKA